MNVRDNLTGILVTGCLVAIGGFALYLNFAPCLSVNWVQLHGFGQADGWTYYEGSCVGTNNSRRLLLNWLKVRKTGKKTMALKAAPTVRMYPKWTTREFVYGVVVIRADAALEKNRAKFVFRVNPSGKLEVCTEIENVIHFGLVVQKVKDGQTDWVRLETWGKQGSPPDGRLTIRFDRCVDGSDLVSFSGRIRSRLHKYGLCADPVQHFIGAVPKITVDDIVFDEKVVSPDLPVPRKNSIRGFRGDKTDE